MNNNSPLHWFSSEKEIITPFAMATLLTAKNAVICFESETYHMLLETCGLMEGEKISDLPGLLEGTMDNDLVICRAFFGAPAAGMLLETLISSGIERVLMVGEAGSVASHCKIGDIFLPSWGIREEGTSYHYLPPDTTVKPTNSLFSKLKECFDDVDIVTGGIWTTDAPFRETRDKIDAYAEKGAVAVEMECTALMAIAMYRETAFAAVIVITDELSGEKWKAGFGGENVKRSKKIVCDHVKKLFSLRRK